MSTTMISLHDNGCITGEIYTGCQTISFLYHQNVVMIYPSICCSEMYSYQVSPAPLINRRLSVGLLLLLLVLFFAFAIS